VLPPRTHNLYCYGFSSLVVQGPHHLTESAPSQSFQQLIAIPDLLVLLPKIPSLQVVLANSTSDSYVIDCLFVD
jgi:hypothetical protein